MNDIILYRYIYEDVPYYLCKYESAHEGDAYYYWTTTDMAEAIARYGEGFSTWMDANLDGDGVTTLKTRIYVTKEYNRSGYKGTLEKEIEVGIKDFEKVTFTEQAKEQENDDE